MSSSKRKDYHQIFSVKKDLSKLDMKKADLPEGTQIFVNQSLCSYYKSLWSKSKKLRSLGKIYSFFISNSIIKIKLQENSDPESITHSSVFDKFFPDVDLSPPVNKLLTTKLFIHLCWLYYVSFDLELIGCV